MKLSPILRPMSITLFFLFQMGSTSAQQLTPFVVSSSGGFYNTSSGMLSFTTGEMAAVETYNSPFAILTQGFQQPLELSTYVTEHPHPNFSFGIYPNPSDGNFSLITKDEAYQEMSVRIFNLIGREIYQTKVYPQSAIHIEPIHLPDATPGLYIVSLRVSRHTSDPQYHFLSKFQIIK